MHYRDLRLFNNAGIVFPRCKADDPSIDLTYAGWPTSGIPQDVTCPECVTMILVSIYGEKFRDGIRLLISYGFDFKAIDDFYMKLLLTPMPSIQVPASCISSVI